MAVPPTIHVPSRDTLRKYYGGQDGLYGFLEALTLEHVVWDDDFMGDMMKYDATAPGTYQSTASGAASAAAALVAGTTNGIVRLTTGTDNAGRSDLSLGLHFRGQLNAAIAVRLKIDVITSAKVEVGFTDVVSGTDAGAVNVLATPSFNADDAVVWCLDTNDTANWKAVGVQATVAATAIAAGIAPTAATYEWLIVALKDTNAFFYRLDSDGKLTYSSAPMTSAITAATDLTPWVFAQTRNTTGKLVDIDRMVVWQRRTIANP